MEWGRRSEATEIVEQAPAGDVCVGGVMGDGGGSESAGEVSKN